MKGAPEPSISRLASRESKIIFRAQTNDSGSIENEEILEPGILNYSIPHYSIPYYSIPYYSIPYYTIPFNFVYISQFLCEYQYHASFLSTSDYLSLCFIFLYYLIFTFPLFISLSIFCYPNLLLISCYFIRSFTSLSFS